MTSIEATIIDRRRILVYAKASPRKICFATTHKGALKKKVSGKFLGTFSVPFIESIGHLLHAQTGNRLFQSSQYDNYWRGIEDESEMDAIERFISEYNGLVFIRDSLDISVALGENFLENDRTEIGNLEYSAKYRGDSLAITNLAELAQAAISELPYFRDTRFVCAVPPSRREENNLPRVVCEKLTSEKCTDLSKCIDWRGTKPPLKGVSMEEKLDILEEIGLDLNCDFGGKDIILIDDLYQSGITMQFVAMKLKEAGARYVFGLALVKSRKNTDNLA